ncbi:MAG: VWA domain-containing protein [Barnesiella sp.]|nr:VWA domain-containing protein [Barnesiella sp.]
MISFANPQYLYLLFVLPVLAIGYIFVRLYRKKRLAKFGKHLDKATLMPDDSTYLPFIKTGIEIIALGLIIIAAARPYVQTGKSVSFDGEDSESVSGIEVMICCDVSNSMLASNTNDINGVSRLQRAKFILDKALDNMHNDRVGLIVFAGNAYLQLPLTPDVYSAKMFVNSLDPKMAPFQGTAIGAAINSAVGAFDPNSQFNKAIVVITDGENFEDNAIAAAKNAAEAGIQVDVIGMGTTGEGMPIPSADSPTGYMIYDGVEVKTALDAEGAAKIAEAGKGIYIAGNSNSAVTDLENQLRKIKSTEYKRTSIPSDSTDLFPIFIAISLLLMLIDIALPYSKLKWLKNFNFFTKSNK